MRARTILALAVLFLSVGARPLMADGPIVFQRDGTFFYSIHAELQAQATAEESDSTEAPKLAWIAGGSLAGLAAYFVATNGGGAPAGFPNLPINTPGGGIVLPPQEQSTPALPNQPYSPPGQGGTNDIFSGPVTTTPEPVTMSLLATGLAGVGAARIRRRRGG